MEPYHIKITISVVLMVLSFTLVFVAMNDKPIEFKEDIVSKIKPKSDMKREVHKSNDIGSAEFIEKINYRHPGGMVPFPIEIMERNKRVDE